MTDDAGFDPLEFWIRHKSKIILYTGLLLGAIIVFGVYQMIEQRTRAAAQAAFASAKTSDDFRKVAADYPRTGAGVSAELMLADHLRAEGKLDEAISTLKDFVAKHSTHVLVAGAYASLASDLEAKGDLAGALSTYQKVTTSFPNSYAAPVGWMGQARVLKAQGKAEEARRAYETVIGQFQGSSFAMEAQRYSQQLKKETAPKESAPSANTPKSEAEAPKAESGEAKPAPAAQPAPAAEKNNPEATKPAQAEQKPAATTEEKPAAPAPASDKKDSEKPAEPKK